MWKCYSTDQDFVYTESLCDKAEIVEMRINSLTSFMHYFKIDIETAGNAWIICDSL